jgi:TolA-binding protein
MRYRYPSHRRARTLGLAAAAVALLAAGCGNPESDSAGESRVREEARELVAALSDYGREQREEVTARLEDTLDDVDARIAELERQMRQGMDDASDTAKRETQEALDDLQARRRDLADRLQDLEQASAEAWDDVRSRTAEALERVAQALENAEP